MNIEESTCSPEWAKKKETEDSYYFAGKKIADLLAKVLIAKISEDEHKPKEETK